jgi:uncharacterized protein YgbK (DUF1537 family)
MTIVRLLADDLTGALDTAAEFVPLTGALPVLWRAGSVDLAGSAAVDSGTRECGPAEAMVQVGRLAEMLRGAEVAFKKIDSLLRGQTIAEIAACMRAGIWRHCALAPAFPYQGRVTRGGRQYRRDAGGWIEAGGDLVAGLQAFGVQARRAQVDTALAAGVSVFDAETEADMQRIVATVRRCDEPVLWVGCGGLAQAIAAGREQPPPGKLPAPILGVFGSDQAATADQLAACAPHWLEIEAADFDPVAGRLQTAGLVLVSFRLAANTERAVATQRIASAIGQLTERIEPPGTVVVSGGETLHSLCAAVGATGLLAQGRLVPGVPRSVMVGGRWDGVAVVSESGAFGPPDLLRTLILERTD